MATVVRADQAEARSQVAQVFSWFPTWVAIPKNLAILRYSSQAISGGASLEGEQMETNCEPHEMMSQMVALPIVLQWQLQWY